MAYKLTFDIKNRYIYVSASGERNFQDNVDLVCSCVDTCKKNNLNRVLLDITGLTGQASTIADYKLAKLLETQEVGKIVNRTALVENEDILSAGKFFETAARNRTINISVFTSRKNAEEWILND